MNARLIIELGDVQTANAVHGALIPEMDDGPNGSTTHLSLEGIVLTADITGTDLSTLRAALNGFVRLLDASRRSIE
jgi:tRNA threonylcarbamoyladenosine modification (KEOPS) complex  Pcc1 subunit